MLDPYGGPDEEILPLKGKELAELVAFYKRTADQNGEPYDPEWDRWLAGPRPPGANGLDEARRRFR